MRQKGKTNNIKLQNKSHRCPSPIENHVTEEELFLEKNIGMFYNFEGVSELRLIYEEVIKCCVFLYFKIKCKFKHLKIMVYIGFKLIVEKFQVLKIHVFLAFIKVSFLFH